MPAPEMTSPNDLKNAGLKATLPRLRIINLFETSKLRHMTAEDVYRQLLSEGIDIGLATIYRVLRSSSRRDSSSVTTSSRARRSSSSIRASTTTTSSA